MESKLFQWGTEFMTGHKDIDDQHYGLIETINRLLQLTFQGKKFEKNDTEVIIKQLTDYTIEHFQTEEVLMADCEIDPRHRTAHVKVHNEFIDKVKSYFMDPNLFQSPEKTSEISEFLIRWLAYHILSMDKSLVRQIDRVQKYGLSPKDAYDSEIKEEDASTEPLLKALKSLFYLVTQKNIELEKRVLERTEALESVNRKLEKLSLLDELTELPNRRFAMQEIEKWIQQYIRYKVPFSLFFIDLNRFKAVNDTYGHEAGDQVLIWFAKFMLKNIRKSDSLCRMGGDEFVVIIPHTHGADAMVMAKHLLQSAEEMAEKDHLPFWKPSFSIGLVEMDETIASASDLLNLADAAMYEAKKIGIGILDASHR